MAETPEDIAAELDRIESAIAAGTADLRSLGFWKLVGRVKKDPELTAEMVKAFCKEQLTGYKLPKFVEFRTELPKSNVGKILRRELRDSPAKA